MEALLEGPRSETLKSPFPTGTQVLSAVLKDGHATVDLSYPYSTLSGVSLTIADYCICLLYTSVLGRDGFQLVFCNKRLFH